jgi:hypothetical protein
MKDEHIVDLIERAPLTSLTPQRLAAIRAHCDHCASCLRAFQAAQVSAFLLKERVAAEFEPPPFFHTRVMATLRERQAANGSWANASAISGLWRTAGALAASMLATVAALAVLTFVVPDSQTTAGTQGSSSANNYSAEEVMLGQTSQLDEQQSDGQVLGTIYAAEEEVR